jgi:hypothetical protein
MMSFIEYGRARLERTRMHFETPGGDVAFDIPDEWWRFAEMDTFTLRGRFYPYGPRGDQEIDAVPLADIEPPLRNSGVPPFKKYKMVPVLFALASPECALPPVEVDALAGSSAYRFKVYNGYHRYYASAAVGYPLPPVVIRPS